MSRKNLAPAIYHVSSPLLAMLGVFLICAGMVYIVLPILRKFGLEMNDYGRKQRKREAVLKALRKALDKPLADFGLTWHDVQDLCECAAVGLDCSSLAVL